MKDGIVIKGMWLLMGSAMKASLPVLGVSNPRAFWKESKKIYRREMDKLDEYGPNDILKINLAHAVMLSAVYEACDPKPDIDAITKFYRELFLRQRIILAALKRMDMLKPSEVRRQRAIATGGEVCDCRYVSKRAATQGEICRSKENKKSEAIRGGRKEL